MMGVLQYHPELKNLTHVLALCCDRDPVLIKQPSTFENGVLLNALKINESGWINNFAGRFLCF